MTRFFTMPIWLTLFDGSAGGDGGAAAAGQASAQGDSTGAPVAPTRQGKKSGEYANVVFGKQPAQTAAPEPAGDTITTNVATDPAAGDQANTDTKVTSNTLEDRRKAFRDMINGEYKDLYAEEFQRSFDRRFRDAKTNETRLQQQQPIIDALLSRYKITDGDLSKLSSAIDNDDSMWAAAADEAGMDVDQFRKFEQLRRSNAAMQAELAQRRQQDQVNRQLQTWYSEAEAVKAKYPAFDFNAECQNQQFLSMLKSGVPVEHAYKVLHMDSIIADERSATAAQTQKAVVDNIRARGMRPAENGASAQSGFTVKDDATKFTKADRAEIARRVRRGEQIVL